MNKLILGQLNQKLLPFKNLDALEVPEEGWLFTIRKSLNMTLEQLGQRLGISPQGVKRIEKREAQGSITIKSLKEVAEALEMNLIYGFSPKHESVEQLVEAKALALATKVVMRTHHNMQLENQGNSKEQIKLAIEELTQELKREVRRSIWN